MKKTVAQRARRGLRSLYGKEWQRHSEVTTRDLNFMAQHYFRIPGLNAQDQLLLTHILLHRMAQTNIVTYRSHLRKAYKANYDKIPLHLQPKRTRSGKFY